MSGLVTEQNAKEVSLQAVVVRADGSREDLGTIAYWHINPLKRLAHRLRHGKIGKIQ